MKLRRSGGTSETTPLERLAIVAASLMLSIGLIAALSGFFASRDTAGVSGASSGPGQSFPDQGNLHIRAGELRPVYDSDPPTSGPHIPTAILQDDTELTSDQLLSALERGNVVLIYGGPAPPAGLTALARSVAAPFTPALAAAGQAVIISGRPRTSGVFGVAWRRLIHVTLATDPRLRDFAQFWLGKGVSGAG